MEDKEKNNEGEVKIKGKKGNDPAATPKKPKEDKGWGAIIFHLLRAPLISALEEILWRSRNDNKKYRHLCLNEFRTDRHKTFWTIAILDFVIIAAFVFVAIFILTLAITTALSKVGILK